MKLITILLFSAVCLNNVDAQEKKFNITGQVTDTTYWNGKIILQYKDQTQKNRRDTSVMQKGNFQFVGTVPIVSRAILYIQTNTEKESSISNRAFSCYFILENENISLKINASRKLIVSDSKINDVHLEFLTGNRAKVKEYNGLELTQQLKAFTDSFIRINPQSAYSLLLFGEKVGQAKQVESLREEFDVFSAEFKNSPIGIEIQNKLEKISNVTIGKQAPQFSLPNLTGKTIQLSDYKGKYLFLHFWASWCSPCREENSYLVNAYQSKNNENLIFLGISVDNVKKDLENAILKDKITWQQLATFIGFDQPIMHDFGIRGVPRNFLLDPDGKIIAMDLRGPNLLEKLKGLVQ
ncbi:TlpA disulfide reductase family protein [Sediminibacterium sp.]|uniref:TlpA disulfide reductase family protein n=1 Tax=Sediminibacterium sp. TaxID=1917865 RepID=UPI002734A9D6|nr:TlpA disulfide reductase family protein [Sediminibacterium sp.]MDP3393009.1 TlpA disulfide reductase family protein [Sediminibacterium sp.]MDP3567215.1 TlpA disulfide reductase family protein [Sediminibacterium sp.]